MKHRSSARPVAASGVLLVSLYLVLAGLFGMHGLGVHGSEATPGMGHAMASPLADTTAHTMASAPSSAMAHGTKAATASMPAMAMGSACLAVLLSLLLLAAARQGAVQPLTLGMLRPALLRTRAVPRAPPDLVALGIHRC